MGSGVSELGATRKRQRPTRVAWALGALVLGGCSCRRLEAEVDGQKFVRCAQASAPSERSVRVGELAFELRERILAITAPRPLVVVAFSGPVDRFTARDVEALARSGAALALYLGGLGDDEASAKHNLAVVQRLPMPTLFVAGGADRKPLLEAAFGALDDSARVFDLSALRELRIGADRFVIAAGAPLGRYALDEQACGLTAEDFADIQNAAARAGAERTWLLSWAAPAETGVALGLSGLDVGSRELRALALALNATGGVYAYPEGRAGQATREPFTLVVPRLGVLGSLRADGSRMEGQFARFVLEQRGPVPLP